MLLSYEEANLPPETYLEPEQILATECQAFLQSNLLSENASTWFRRIESLAVGTLPLYLVKWQPGTSSTHRKKTQGKHEMQQDSFLAD